MRAVRAVQHAIELVCFVFMSVLMIMLIMRGFVMMVGEGRIGFTLLSFFLQIASGFVGSRHDGSTSRMCFDNQETIESTFNNLRFEADFLGVFHRRMVIRHQHAVLLTLRLR